MNSQGVWLPICGDGWSGYSARVACQQMGFSDGREMQVGEWNGEANSMWLSNVSCTGRETRLDVCDNDGWRDTCPGLRPAGVRCVWQQFVYRCQGRVKCWTNAMNVKIKIFVQCEALQKQKLIISYVWKKNVEDRDNQMGDTVEVCKVCRQRWERYNELHAQSTFQAQLCTTFHRMYLFITKQTMTMHTEQCTNKLAHYHTSDITVGSDLLWMMNKDHEVGR